MTCAREDDCLKTTKKKMQLEPHARKCVCVLYVRGAVYCLHLPSHARESHALASETLEKITDSPPSFEKSTRFATLSTQPKTTMVWTRNFMSIAFLEMVLDESDGW